mmetsp:Transcript_14311/g.21427  ORF Transcript_14311/g.21427 Transcript_14311/m.21427 type:complete len:215 (+) Transcript_14311:106-750(+)
MAKVDTSGNYCRFEGFTIVSCVDRAVLSSLQTVYDALAKSELISNYYSPLPLDSYHMTTTMLHNKSNLNDSESWEEFVYKNMEFYQHLKASVDQQNIKPVFSVKYILVSSAIFLMGTIDESHERSICELAEQYGLTSFLPFFSNRKPREFHITLAYQYKSMSDSTSQNVKETILKAIGNALPSEHIHLDSPQLCYHNDMTGFHPWNAISYPFES